MGNKYLEKIAVRKRVAYLREDLVLGEAKKRGIPVEPGREQVAINKLRNSVPTRTPKKPFQSRFKDLGKKAVPTWTGYRNDKRRLWGKGNVSGYRSKAETAKDILSGDVKVTPGKLAKKAPGMNATVTREATRVVKGTTDSKPTKKEVSQAKRFLEGKRQKSD